MNEIQEINIKITKTEKIKSIYKLIYKICTYLDEECEQICKTIWKEDYDHFLNKFIPNKISKFNKNISYFFGSLDSNNKRKFVNHLKTHFSKYTINHIKESINLIIWLYNSVGLAHFLILLGWTYESINNLTKKEIKRYRKFERILINLTNIEKKNIYNEWKKYFQSFSEIQSNYFA